MFSRRYLESLTLPLADGRYCIFPWGRRGRAYAIDRRARERWIHLQQFIGWAAIVLIVAIGPIIGLMDIDWRMAIFVGIGIFLALCGIGAQFVLIGSQQLSPEEIPMFPTYARGDASPAVSERLLLGLTAGVFACFALISVGPALAGNVNSILIFGVSMLVAIVAVMRWFIRKP